MKHFSSIFHLKNSSLGAKMRKGIKTSCNGDVSTSTLNQHNPPLDLADHQSSRLPITYPSTTSHISSPNYMQSTSADTAQSPLTLEEMILRLELEEEIARKSKLKDYGTMMRGRRSCVNNSDILRSARNALNQYPRFSLDGKDAMYRSSFRNLHVLGKPGGGRKSVCCDRGTGLRAGRLYGHDDHDHDDFRRNKLEKTCCLPTTLGGKNVMWRKPGVVARLMGLEAMPVPVPVSSEGSKVTLSNLIKRQNLRRRAERHEVERRLAMDHQHISNCNDHNDDDYGIKRGMSSKASRCCVRKPVPLEPPYEVGGSWLTRTQHGFI